MTMQSVNTQTTTLGEKAPSPLSDSWKLSSSTDDGGPQEIHQSIPDGIEIRRVPYGYGIFATKFFPATSTIYTGHQLVIPNRYAEFRLVIDNGKGGEFMISTETHAVQFNESERFLYLFDSFTNHSCDPTTESRNFRVHSDHQTYDTVAVRDIHPGDEITCNYNLYEYDCHDKLIEKCLCGSSNCYGRVAGYKYLPREVQKALIQDVEKDVLEAMAADPSNKLYFIQDLKTPLDRIRIEEPSLNSFKMIAQRDFAREETVYSNTSLLFPEDWEVVLVINGRRKWLTETHTCNKGNGIREFFYFDSFQNHSCDPNTTMVYLSANCYDLVAAKDINKGDELTRNFRS